MTYLNNTHPDIGPTGKSDISPVSPPSVIFAPLAIEDETLNSRVDALSVKLAAFAPADIPDEAAVIYEEPASFPGSPDQVYTARLRALLPIFIAQLFSMFAVDIIQQGAAARLKELRQALRALYTTDKQNFVTCAVHALQTNPVWQSQVCEDLGGEAALQKWEQREAKLQSAEPSSNERPARAERPAASATAKPSQIRTDRTGLFRLAALSKTEGKKPSKSSARQRPLRNFSLKFRAPKAIGLMPQQLRPQTQNPASTPMFYERLLEIWQIMQMDHDNWNHLLVIADLMLGNRAFREAYAPP